MRKPRVSTYAGAYKGNYWAIVLGHKDKDIKPLPLVQWVRTPNKKRLLEEERAKYPGRVIRAIPMPYDGMFTVGM